MLRSKNSEELVNIRFIDSCCIRLTLFSLIAVIVNGFVITLVLVTPNIKTLVIIKLIVLMTLPFVHITLWMILSVKHKIYRVGKHLIIKRFMQSLELPVENIDTSKGILEPRIKNSCLGLCEILVNYTFSDSNKNTYSGSSHRISLTSPTTAKNIQGKINFILDKCNKETPGFV